MEQDLLSIEKSARVSKEILAALADGRPATSVEETGLYPELSKTLSEEEFYRLMSERNRRRDKEKSKQNLIKRIRSLRRRRTTMRWSIAAACVAAMLVTGRLIFFDNIPASESAPAGISETVVVITPDGREIALDRDFDRLTDIIAETVPAITSETETPEKFYTIVVPRQRTYGLMLPDSSCVTLNAGSSLSYSDRYNTDNRSVTLKGEGFFDVRKSNKPFTVTCNSIMVTVLGTQFNVNSYDAANFETVLVEGSVSVSSDLFGENIVIQPGQMINISTGTGSWWCKEVDTYVYTAWKNERFYYNGSSLAVMLRQIESWFGITVEYDSEVDPQKIVIYASLSKSLALEEIMKIIETIADVKFIKEGDRYILTRY